MVLNWKNFFSALFITGFIFSFSFFHISCKGCGNSTPDNILPSASTSTNSNSSATFTQVYSIFNSAGCLTSSCHSSSTNPKMGSQSQAYTNLVGVTSSCSSKVYVVANSTSTSYLVEKIATTPSCGSKMPQGNSSYFDSNPSQLQTIKDWINASAPNN